MIHRGGWAARDKAVSQFARFPYLHFPKEHQRWLRPFLAFAEEDAAEKPIAAWIGEQYDPVRLRDWLAVNGHEGTFKGIFERPVASRWQW